MSVSIPGVAEAAHFLVVVGRETALPLGSSPSQTFASSGDVDVAWLASEALVVLAWDSVTPEAVVRNWVGF